MLLFKSLICLKGNDNGRRFLIISLCCYLLLIVLTPVLAKAIILLVLLLLTATPILAAGAIRRMRDAGFSLYLSAFPIVIFIINVFGLSYFEHGSKWLLILLAVIVTLAMATISNARMRRNYTYKHGYFGPIDIKEAVISPVHHSRIEPTIAGQSNHQDHHTQQGRQEIGDTSPLPFEGNETSELTENSTINSENNTSDKMSTEKSLHTSAYEEARLLHSEEFDDQNPTWEQQLNYWFIQNKKLALIVSSIALVLIVSLVLFSIPEDKPIDEEKQIEPKTILTKQRLNKIEMPDQFWLMLDQNNALTIGWIGDFKSDKELGENGSYWSAETAKGDKDCVDLHFSLGENIRTLKVTVIEGEDYYADFSPVDTQLIIKSIADKDKFKLCGYEFTLKGTRSLLRKNQAYFKYLKVE